MSFASHLPPGARELRGEEQRDATSHTPFLGGVERRGVLFFLPKRRKFFLISYAKLLQAGAEAAGCTVDELVEYAKLEIANSHCGPGGPVHTGARHGQPRRTR